MERSKKIRRLVSSALRRKMLFSVGSALILHEKAQEFVEHAIERGQEAQKEGKKLVEEMRSHKMRSHKMRSKNKPHDKLDSHISGALERLDVASQKDVEELDQHVAALSKRVDELQAG